MTSPSWTARLLCAGLIACALDGAVRKWLFFNAPYSLQALSYFAKDVGLVLAAVVSVQNGRPTPALRAFRNLLGFSLALVAAGILANLGEVQPMGGLASLRTMIIYPLLATLIAQGLRGQRDVLLIIQTIGWLTVVNAIIGSAQFYLPKSSFLNQQIGADVAVHSIDVGGHVSRIRATGTFAFITGMGDMAIAGAWAGCLLLLLQPQRLLGHLFLGAGFVCSLAGMSRFGFALAFIVAAGTLLASPRRGRLIAGWGAVVLAVFALLTFLGGEEQRTNILEALFVRHQSSDSFGDRLYSEMQLFLAIEEFPFGRGLGFTQAVQKASGVDLAAISRYETELARIVVEVGIVGMVGVVLSRLVYLHRFWAGSTWSGNSQVRFTGPICWACLWVAAIFFAHGPCFNHISSTFVCVSSAVALGAIQIRSGGLTPTETPDSRWAYAHRSGRQMGPA